MNCDSLAFQSRVRRCIFSACFIYVLILLVETPAFADTRNTLKLKNVSTDRCLINSGGAAPSAVTGLAKLHRCNSPRDNRSHFRVEAMPLSRNSFTFSPDQRNNKLAKARFYPISSSDFSGFDFYTIAIRTFLPRQHEDARFVRIRSASNDSLCLNVKHQHNNRDGGSAMLAGCSQHIDQLWIQIPDADGERGVSQFLNVGVERCLSVERAQDSREEDKVIVQRCTNIRDQSWRLEHALFLETSFSLGRSIQGDRTGRFGEFGILPAVEDVQRAFVEASGSRNHRHRFWFDAPDISANGERPDSYSRYFGVREDHIQTFARLSGEGFNTHFLMTRNARDIGDAGIYVGWFDKFSSDGDAWKWSPDRRHTNGDETANKYFYYRMRGVNHAGGAQVLGQMAFIAGDCDAGHQCDAYVGIYDLRNMGINSGLRVMSRIRIQSNSETLQPYHPALRGPVSSRAAAVAATRLRDGRYLAFVRGREHDRSGWFYVSSSRGLRGREWQLLDFWHQDDLADGAPWHAWETLNFVTERSTGDIFMIAFGHKESKAFLYKVVQTQSASLARASDLNFEYVAGRELNTYPLRNRARFGAGSHITPSGKIVSYTTSKEPHASINEFRPRVR